MLPKRGEGLIWDFIEAVVRLQVGCAIIMLTVALPVVQRYGSPMTIFQIEMQLAGAWMVFRDGLPR